MTASEKRFNISNLKHIALPMALAIAILIAISGISATAYAESGAVLSGSGVVGQSGQPNEEESIDAADGDTAHEANEVDEGSGELDNVQESTESQEPAEDRGQDEARASGAVLSSQNDNSDAGYDIGQTFSDANGITYKILTLPTGDSAGTVQITDGKNCTKAELILGVVELDGKNYEVSSVASGAFAGNTVIQRITFTETSSWVAFEASAFKECTTLKRVEMPAKITDIAKECFYGCTALEEITYPVGATISNRIGTDAFSKCSSLKVLTIPAMPYGSRRADFYCDFATYNEREWYGSSNDEGPVNQFGGFGSGHFINPGPLGRTSITYSRAIVTDCPNLETIVFMPGSPIGAFAFSDRVNTSRVDYEGYFKDCPNLKSIVYETAQPWYYDPNGMGDNSTYYKDALAQMEGIDLYYAVDYYASKEAAEQDDHYGTSRLARVEYKRDTPMEALATGDAALQGWVYGNVSEYAQTDADGAVLDPNAVAREQGYDASVQWIWHLTDTQSRRDGLSESCKAYLAPAADLQNGRLGGEQVSALYRVCDYVCSRGMLNGEAIQDTKYGPEQFNFYGDVETIMQKPANYPSSQSYDPWIELGSNREASLKRAVTVYDAAGTPLDWSTLEVTYQRYDTEAKQLEDTSLATCGNEALLLTISPAQGSGYTGVLQEWVCVRVHAGTVDERYTDDASGTWYEASRPAGVSYLDYQAKGVPYSVGISSADKAGAVVAAGYAGLTGSPIHVANSEDASFGFQVGTVFYASGRFGSDSMSFNRAQDSLQAWSVAAFQAFERVRESNDVGASREAYPWGSEAVLVNPVAVNDVGAAAAAYAYAMKCPVFYSGEDGSVGDELLDVLSGFDGVAVFGDASCFSEAAFSELEEKLGSDVAVSRIQGDARSASSLTLAVAKELVEQDKASLSAVAISDASDVIDAVSSLEFTGFSRGVTLVSACTADSKTIASFLAENKDQINTVMLFGRDGSNTSSDSFDLGGFLSGLWTISEDAPEVVAGDTLVLSGARYAIGEGGALEYVDDLWQHEVVPGGTYEYAGKSYTIAVQDSGSDTMEPTDGGQGDSSGSDTQKPSGSTLAPISWGRVNAQPQIDWIPAPEGDGPSGVSGKAHVETNGSISGVVPGVSGVLAAVENIPTTTAGSGAAGGSGWLNVTNSTSSSAQLSSNTSTSTPSSGTTTATASNSGNRLVLTSNASGSGSGSNGEDDTESHSNPTARTGTIAAATSSSGNSNTNAADGARGNANVAENGTQGTTLDPSANVQRAHSDEEGSDAQGGAGEQSGSLPPVAVGCIVAAVVAALGAAMWFALRRPNDEAEFDEELIEA